MKTFDSKDDLKTALDKSNKSKKIWMIVGIAAGVAFLGAIIYVMVGSDGK